MEELSKVAQYCEQDTSFKEPPKSASSINKSHYKPSEFGLRCRHRLLAEHFGDDPSSVICRRTCDVCADPLVVARDIERMRFECASRRSGLGTTRRDEFSSGDPELYGGGRHSANMYSYIVSRAYNLFNERFPLCSTQYTVFEVLQ